MSTVGYDEIIIKSHGCTNEEEADRAPRSVQAKSFRLSMGLIYCLANKLCRIIR